MFPKSLPVVLGEKLLHSGKVKGSALINRAGQNSSLIQWDTYKLRGVSFWTAKLEPVRKCSHWNPRGLVRIVPQECFVQEFRLKIGTVLHCCNDWLKTLKTALYLSQNSLPVQDEWYGGHDVFFGGVCLCCEMLKISCFQNRLNSLKSVCLPVQWLFVLVSDQKVPKN